MTYSLQTFAENMSYLDFLLKIISLMFLQSALFFQLALDQANTLCSVRNKRMIFFLRCEDGEIWMSYLCLCFFFKIIISFLVFTSESVRNTAVSMLKS